MYKLFWGFTRAARVLNHDGLPGRSDDASTAGTATFGRRFADGDALGSSAEWLMSRPSRVVSLCFIKIYCKRL